MYASFLGGLSGSTFDENVVNTGLQLIAPDVIFADNDGNLDTHGMTITVSGLLAEDVVTLQDSAKIYLVGSSIMYDYDGAGSGSANEVGTISGGVGGDLQILLNTWASVDMVEVLIEHLAYGNSSNEPTATRDLVIKAVGVDGMSNLWEDAWSLGGRAVNGGASIGLFDMNGDGYADLFTETAGALFYVLGDGAGGFGGTSYYALDSLAGSSTTPAGFDADGDGDLDLVLGVPDGTLVVHLNNGDGTFSQDRSTMNPFLGIDVDGMSAPTFGDLDGDGDLDLVIGGDGELHLYRNDGGVFTAAGNQAAGQGRLAPALFDADGDGDLDIIFGDGTGAFAILAMDGFTFGALDSDYEHWDLGDNGGVAATDLDGDGDIDLMLTGERNGNSQSMYRLYSRLAQNTVEVTVTPQDEAATTGSDEMDGTGGDDVIDGLGGDDTLDGGAGSDELIGGDGDDYLKGGDGDDTLIGGTGNDTYVVDSLGDTADETGGDGVDLIISRVSWTLGVGIENLTLGNAGGGASGTGNALDNVITGNAGANTLSGLDGEDTLIGGAGNDVLQGGDGDDVLDGGNGADWLDGGAGADAMTGGAGNDTYVIDNVGDTVTELAGGGTDTIQTDIVGADLANFANVENVTLTGSADIGVLGNDGANVLIGNVGRNYLLGGDGADILYGMDGGDFLMGDLGADKLYGGAGRDVFAFYLVSEVAGDRIMDLNFAEGDYVELVLIDADTTTDGNQDFTFVTRFSKQAGQAMLVYNATSDVTYLRLDVDGDGVMDAQMAINGDHRDTTTNLYTGPSDADGGWML